MEQRCRCGAQQPAQRQKTNGPALTINQIDFLKFFGDISRKQSYQSFGDCHACLHRDKFTMHDAPGGFLGKQQRIDNLGPVCERDLR